MYAEAFFEDDPVQIVEAGLKCIPAESQYAEMRPRRARLARARIPTTGRRPGSRIEDKYHNESRTTAGFSCSGKGEFNIDAKLNGAYIVMGLLYGKGDLDQTIIISTRCGQDSDCNPSNAARHPVHDDRTPKLPERFTSALDPKAMFSHTAYNFDAAAGGLREAGSRGGGPRGRTDREGRRRVAKCS